MGKLIHLILPRLVWLKAAQWQSCEGLEQKAESRLARVLEAASRTEYYKGVFTAAGLTPEVAASDLSLLPITRKSSVISSPEAFLGPSGPRNLIKLKTAGSTGDPAIIYSSEEAMNLRFATSLLARSEFGMAPTDRFADLCRVDRSSRARPTLLNRMGLFRRAFIDIFAGEGEQLREMRAFRADIAGWYPSALSLLAKANLSSGRALRLKSVFCGSETLTASCRRLIGESFSCEVFQQYGTTEFGTMAFECPEEHSLHVNTQSCKIEIVGRNGRPKKGGPGQVVVTGLDNLAMPLVRYSLDDLAGWGGECPCGRGFPTLRSVQGRTVDYITLPSGRRRPSLSMEYIDDLLFLRFYQIVQEREDLLVFRYMTFGGDLDEAQKKLVEGRILQSCLGEEVGVEFEKLESPPRTGGGKIRTVISKVSRGGAP
jgi:phenylacetate-CoA ligase